MQKFTSIGPAFIIFAALLWALDGVLRISLYTLPAAVVVFYEHALGFVILLLFSLFWIHDLKKMTRKEWIAIIIVSLFSGALGTILYTAALQKVHFLPYSIVVVLEQQLQPIWAILAAAILLKEKITKQFVLWASVAIISIYLVTFKDLHVNLHTGTQTILAAIFAVTSGFMWGTSTAISKFVLNKVNSLTATAERFFFAPIFALFFIIPQNQASALTHLTLLQFLTLLLITLSTGMVAVVIYYFGLKRTPARVSSICELTFPAAAVFIDYFYYHNILSFTQIVGVLILVYAMLQVTKQFKKDTVSHVDK